MKGVLQITDNSKTYPNHEEIRQIFNETYNVFYKKWKDISNPADWDQLMQEVREINKKYDYDLCQQILIELVMVIENEYLKSKEGYK